MNSVKKVAGLSTSYNDSYGGHSVFIEQWLQGLDNCDIEVTPDVIRIKRIPMREKQELRDAANKLNAEDGSCAASSAVEDLAPEDDKRTVKEPGVSETPVGSTLSRNKCGTGTGYAGTPVEPELSEYTTQLLSLRSFAATKETASSHVSESQSKCSQNSVNDVGSKFLQGKAAGEPHKLTKLDLYFEGHKPNAKNCTPEEPTLSHKLSQLTTTGHVGTETPEEPVLSHPVPSYQVATDVETRTPEDPVLSYTIEPIQVKPGNTRTPDEPVLSGLLNTHNTAPSISTGTPEEPLLSYQVSQSRSSSIVDKKTPKEPVLSTFASAMHTSSHSDIQHKKFGDMPTSPELSDITQSFLSLRNCSSGVDCTSKAKEYSDIKSSRVESHYTYESKKTQLPYEKSVIYARQGREVYAQENVTQHSTEPREKKNWFRPGVKVEKFLGGGDIPPSPQLSETTQRLFSWK